MKARKMTIEFSSSLSNVVELNPSFDSARLRIAYTGKNRNNSFISKEAFERAIPTMFNCPIVANYMRETNEIGSHDGEFIKDSDGKTKYVNITQPVGVVPESAQYDWETVEDNGVLHQYLCTDVILWKRQEAYQKIKDNGVTDQSMEISVTDGEMLDDYYNIKDFCFTAFCLLGTAEPCFESAALFTFSTEDFKQQYTEMMKEFKAAFCAAHATAKEGERNLKLKELLEKYNVSEADLQFDYKDLSDKELEAKFAEAYEADQKKKGKSDDDPHDEPKDEPDEPEEPAPEEDDEPEPQNDEPDSDNDSDGDSDETSDDDGGDSGFSLNSQESESLYKAISEEKIDTDWGSYSRRWMVDYDASLQEVYYYDYEDGNLYGCSFRFDGDDAIIDFKNCKRKKYAIIDYVEGTEQNFVVRDLIESFDKAYSAASIDKAEFERLQAFEQEVLKERRKADEAALFEQFETQLHESDEFEALKSNSGNYSLDQLEKELFVLIGKMNFSFSEKKKDKNTAPMIPPKDDSKDEFGGLFAWKKNEKED